VIDFAKHRAVLESKLAARRQMRLEAETSSSSECDHEWQHFKETVVVQERSYEQSKLGMDYKGHRAYFFVKACVKCKEKHRIGYRVDK